MIDTPSSPSIDEPAAEAVEKIFEADAEQRDKSVLVGKYDCRFCGRRHSNGWYCKARLTAEHQVREKLVDALKGISPLVGCRYRNKDCCCSGCIADAAVAEAEKLDK